MKTPTGLALAGLGLGLCLSLTLALSAARGDGKGAGPGFDARVAPVLARRCLDCHSGADPKGKLDLSRRAAALAGGKSGPAVVPGKPDESALWERVEAGDMPPKSPLPEAEKALLRDWIAAGASWGTDPIDPFQATTDRRAGRDWWSLRPVVRPVPPGVKRPDWVRNPVDRFVLARLDAEGLAPAPEADRRTLIRRVTFDLTGLPPTPAEVDAFAADPAPDAYERLVERLLASPQYGARWARRWLDLARYGESNGFEYDEFRPNAWRYRDWVVNALNADLPYHEFARLQLAGDVLRPGDPSAVEATGFLVAGAFDTAGQNQQSLAMRAVVRGDELEDVIGTVGQTFLGLTIHCARCHDHKFDPVTTVEYYRLASALDGVRHGERDLSPLDPSQTAARRRADALAARVAAIEAPARRRLQKDRPAAAADAPSPVAAWDFDRGPSDRVGNLAAVPSGDAKWTPEGLRLDGRTGYASTPALARDLKTHTLEAWVKLDRLDQAGGGVISLQNTDGGAFDAVVFAEREPARWMAGSEGFARYRSVGGPPETEADRRPVHVAATYAADGTVRLYRDGKPYGHPYKSTGPAEFRAGRAQVLFGLRHVPAGGNRLLAGTVVRARLYDRALSPAEVAASAAAAGEFVTTEAVVAALGPAEREERARLLAESERLRSLPPRRAYAVTPRPAGVTAVQVRGNPAVRGATVAAGGVAALAGVPADFRLAPDAPDADRRKALADWVSDRRNPLFARVVVNRLWQSHFGAGLVETPSDLGYNGGKPSHPELLDWLAAELTEQGGSLKALHRLMVTSAAYRQSSRPDPKGLARDAGARLLWRKPPARLEAEMVRDAMLAVAGRLDPSLGGPSFRDYEVSKAPGTPAVLYLPVDPATPGLNRRTLYRAWARGGRSALLDAFDCPDPSTTAPRRAVTTTPLQALALMNNALVLHLSDALAARLAREAGPDPGKQVDLAYRLAFGREPDPAERARAVPVVEKYGAAALARAVFNSNEFLYVD